MKKKILIIGPIADFGGRELMSGFIGGLLSENYHVDIVSTGDISDSTQAREFFPNGNIFSLKQLLFTRSFLIAIIARFSHLKSNKKGSAFNYVNSVFAKKYLGYEINMNNVISDLIVQYDLILINAQLSSQYNSQITSAAKKAGIKILFRTTGTIKSTHDYPFLTDVGLFVHHSESNASNLSNIFPHKYVVIDQCSFIEERLLDIPILNTKVNKFLYIGRISEEKGVCEVISFFLKYSSSSDDLTIVGDGPLLKQLKNLFESDRIKFVGFIPSMQLEQFYRDSHCVIIPSPEESGPLVGVEAMAAAKIIISTKVGAMLERLSGLQTFWYNYNNEESFKNAFDRVKELSPNDVLDISQSVRRKYKLRNSLEKISTAYRNTVAKLLENA